MILCWLLRTFLEAEITSILTSPRPVNEIHSIQELVEGRQLVYELDRHANHHKQTISSKLASTLEVKSRGKKMSMLGVKITELKAFTELLKTAIVNQNLRNDLIIKDKLAHIGYATFIKNLMVKIQNSLTALSLKNKLLERTRCYLGPSNMLTEAPMVALTGPASEKYIRAFHLIADAGILQYWFSELQLTMTRIQDRNRLKNGEMIKEPSPTFPLRLHDRIRNVFVGWSILLCVGGAILLHKLSSKHKLYLNVVTYIIKVISSLPNIFKFMRLVFYFRRIDKLVGKCVSEPHASAKKVNVMPHVRNAFI